ncbi:MAG: hypothetical protein K6G51_00235 [Sphaerochaetaceae bacterium]|nr:hypothetical protein [Sphaerochaetaceae bacterium]
MANGEEDLREKNRTRIKSDGKNYSKWTKRVGHEDAEMLEEKRSYFSYMNSRHRRGYEED